MTSPYLEPPRSARPFYRQPWFVVVGGLAAIAVVGAVIGGGSREVSPPVADPTTSSSSPAPRPADTAEPAVTEASPVSSPQPTTPAVTPPTATVDFVMPDAVGLDLQSAQDLVQTFGVFVSVSHDLRGSRNQALDSNWIVCDQNIPSGQRVTGDVEGQIDFGVVKRNERCP